MRILLVLLHDFPDFLAEYYLSLVEALPPHCTQIRNVVLSAFPRNTTLPDPVAYDFELADAHKLLVPTIASDYVAILGAAQDEGFDHIAYMAEMIDVHVPEAMKKIASTGSDGQVRYNLPFLNAAVLSLGIHAVDYLMLSPGGVKTDWTFEAQRPSVVAFERMAAQLDNEGTCPSLPETLAAFPSLQPLTLDVRYSAFLPAPGQYHLISSIVNNLRHPSAHTHWFAHLLLHLFGTTTGSAVAGGPAAPLAEIIARVLLERVVVARPHPWGVLVTFIQMLRLPGFWNQDFVRRSRELEAMFKTCAS
jgi:CCR4-NOT transcription complex subunit 1